MNSTCNDKYKHDGWANGSVKWAFESDFQATDAGITRIWTVMLVYSYTIENKVIMQPF